MLKAFSIILRIFGKANGNGSSSRHSPQTGCESIFKIRQELSQNIINKREPAEGAGDGAGFVGKP